MKLATFFISSTKFIFTKLLSVSERLIKIKVRSHWALFLDLIPSAVIYKQRLCIETRLSNIFKTTNAINPYEDIQGS